MAIHFDTLAMAVIIVIVIGLGMYFAVVGRQFDPLSFIESATDLNLGKEGGIEYQNPELTNPEPYEDLPGIRILTSEGSENNLHELGCSIADDIYNDFTTNGIVGNRDASFCINQHLWSADPVEQCLVSVKSFVLGDPTATSAQLSSWESTLSSREPPCHVCQEPAGTSIVEFDEVCINNNLKDRKVSSSNFCNGVITVNSDVIKFGNAQCNKYDVNSQAWKDHCDGWTFIVHQSWENTNWPTDDFCDNDKDMLYWLGNNNNGDPPTMVKDNTGPSKYLTYSNDISLTEHHYYIYGLIWLPVWERYDIMFVRTPGQSTQSSFDFIKNVFQNNYERWNRLGLWRQEARMVVDAIVTPTSSRPVNDLITEIATAAGLDPSEDVSISYNCGDYGNCITTTLEGPEEVCSPYVTEALNSYFQKETIKFITSEADNGELQAGKEYRVIVTNWYGGWDEVEGVDLSCYDYYDRTVIIVSTEDVVSIPTHDEDTQVVWTVGIKNIFTGNSNDGRIMVSSPSAGTRYVPSSTGWCSDTSSCVMNVVLEKDEDVTLRITPKDSSDNICLHFVWTDPDTGDEYTVEYCHVDASDNPIPGTWTMVFPDELEEAGWEDPELFTGKFYAAIY